MSINLKLRRHRGSCWLIPTIWIGRGTAGGSRYVCLNADVLLWGVGVNIWWKQEKKKTRA